MTAPKKIYLGDAVYAAFDGYGLTLTTEDGVEATNTIYLDPNVIGSLFDYVKAIKGD
jgi:hypothetical protein